MEWETAEEKSSLKSQAHQKEGIDLVSLFAKCDMDKDGVIDWHDFLMTASNKRRLFSGFNIEETFATIDFYQKGYLSFDDFHRLFFCRESSHFFKTDVYEKMQIATNAIRVDISAKQHTLQEKFDQESSTGKKEAKPVAVKSEQEKQRDEKDEQIRMMWDEVLKECISSSLPESEFGEFDGLID